MKGFSAKREAAGFTLIEVLLTSAIAMVVAVILIGVLINNTGLFYQQSGVVKEGLSLNNTLQTISLQIKQSTAIASGYPDISPTFMSSANQLVLKLASLDASGVIAGKYDYIIIYQDPALPKVLRMQTFADPASNRNSADEVLTTVLDSVIFSYFDRQGLTVVPTSAVTVKVNLTVLEKSGQIGSKRASSISVTLRNLL